MTTTDKQPRVEHRTGGSNCWATPRPFLMALLATLGLPPITLDVAAEAHTAVAPLWYGPGSPYREDALSPEPWANPGGTGLLNPPYGRRCCVCEGGVWTPADLKRGVVGCTGKGHASTSIDTWVKRACAEGSQPGAQASPLLLLVPARTGAAWYLRAVAAAHTVVHVTGRMRFLQVGSESGRLEATDAGAPFDSAVFVFEGPTHGAPYVLRHVDAHGRPCLGRRGYAGGEVAA